MVRFTVQRRTSHGCASEVGVSEAPPGKRCRIMLGLPLPVPQSRVSNRLAKVCRTKAGRPEIPRIRNEQNAPVWTALLPRKTGRAKGPNQSYRATVASNWFRDKYPVGTVIRFRRRSYLPVKVGVVESHLYEAVAIVRVEGQEHREWVGHSHILEVISRAEVNNDNFEAARKLLASGFRRSQLKREPRSQRSHGRSFKLGECPPTN